MGIVGERHHLNFHIHIPNLLHHHHHGHHEKANSKELKDIPKGCLAILVGQGEEQRQRFVIPVIYINHPLFMHLLKEAEEEYGFDHKGPITIPCQVEEFRTVQGIIDKEKSTILHHHHHHHHHTTTIIMCGALGLN
jgi:SAUR family protein